MSLDELIIRARRLVEEALNRGDLAVANELISSGYIHRVPGGRTAPGLAGVKDWLALTQLIFPDFYAIVEDEIAERGPAGSAHHRPQHQIGAIPAPLMAG